MLPISVTLCYHALAVLPRLQLNLFISNLTRSKKMSVKFRNVEVAEIVDEVAITVMSLAIVLSVPLFMLTSI
jgi:hypothetical protein